MAEREQAVKEAGGVTPDNMMELPPPPLIIISSTTSAFIKIAAQREPPFARTYWEQGGKRQLVCACALFSLPYSFTNS